jgi:hypothetical protein
MCFIELEDFVMCKVSKKMYYREPSTSAFFNRHFQIEILHSLVLMFLQFLGFARSMHPISIISTDKHVISLH